MITKQEYAEAVEKTICLFEKTGIVLTEEEKKRIEVADFGLSDLQNVGLQLLTYVNTEKVCAKEMALFPFQTCPQHKHVGNGTQSGKEETFRCRKGKVYLYVSGDGNRETIRGVLPKTKISVFKEIVLEAGEQYTLYPETWHWFQAGKEGAVISEFSTTSTDETDVFFDENVKRTTVIA